MTDKKTVGAVTLVGLIGTLAAGALVESVKHWEGLRRTSYRDVVNVWTVCWGDTRNVVPGRTETLEQCERRLERQLIEHAKPVIACVPGLKAKGREYQLAASVSLAYNIGPSAFCKSTAARRFNAGDWRGGCDAFLRWNMGGGRVIRGLTLRRQRERAICLKGL